MKIGCRFGFALLKGEGAFLYRVIQSMIVSSMFLLAGCSNWGHWPIEGTGGYGELLPVQDGRLQAQMIAVERFRLAGAARAAAAHLQQADVLVVRTRRELLAGLWEDSVLDMDRIDVELRAMGQQMPQVRPKVELAP